MANLRLLRGLGMGLALAGCSSMQIEHTNGDEAALLQALPADDAAYTETKSCLSRLEYDSVEVAGDQHLLFFGHDDIWVNELRSRCPGLEHYDTLAFDLTGDRVCSLDSVSGVDRRFFSWDRGPTCTLGEFRKVSEVQAQRLREAR